MGACYRSGAPRPIQVDAPSSPRPPTTPISSPTSIAPDASLTEVITFSVRLLGFSVSELLSRFWVCLFCGLLRKLRVSLRRRLLRLEVGLDPRAGPLAMRLSFLTTNIFQLKLRSLGLGLDSGISGISGLAPTRTHSGRSGFSGWLWRYLWTWRERRLSSTHS